jgi:hypothetical protein
MENKEMIQVAKWLIVAGLLFPILRNIFLNHQSIEALAYCEFPGLISYSLQTVGWILLLVSAKDKHWKLASGIFSFGMVVSFLVVALEIKCCYNCIAQYNSGSFNAIEEYFSSKGMFELCTLTINVILCVIAIPMLSVGGTKRYKTSVSSCLIAFLLPGILYLYSLTNLWFQNRFDMLRHSNNSYLQQIWGYIPWLFCLVLGAFAFGRMITLYERGEGTSDSPLQMKKIFTSRCFMAAILFLFVLVCSAIFLPHRYVY